MKLKGYIKNLQNLVDENPKAADYKVVYAVDDEGNGFGLVGHTPSFGSFEEGDFVQEDNSEEFKENYKINAICIN